MLNTVMSKLKQPTTMMALAILVALGVYWVTGSTSAAGGAAALMLGGLDDHTATIIAKLEAAEDAVKAATKGPSPNV